MNNLPIHFSLKLIDGDITVWLDPPPPLSLFYLTPLPPRPVTYFLNGPLGQLLGPSISFHSQYTKMRLMNMLKICLAFLKSEPQYAYNRYAYKKTCM